MSLVVAVAAAVRLVFARFQILLNIRQHQKKERPVVSGEQKTGAVSDDGRSGRSIRIIHAPKEGERRGTGERTLRENSSGSGVIDGQCGPSREINDLACSV